MSLVIQYASAQVNMKELTSITDPMILIEKAKGFILPFLMIISDKPSLLNNPSVLCNIQPGE